MLGNGPLLPTQFFNEGIEMVSGRTPLISWRYVNFISGPVEDAYWIEIYPRIAPKPYGAASMAAAPLFFTTGGESVKDLVHMGSVPPYEIYLDPSAVSRVRFYSRAVAVKDRTEARALLWGGRNPFEELWYEGPPVPGVSPEAKGECVYRLPSTDEYEIRCKATGPGFVWVSQSYYPGWRAYVNGVAAPVYAAHLLFQAVPIPSGESSIVLKYRPKYFVLSLVLALIGLGIPLALSAICASHALLARRT
jgi:hypothetical protein